MLVFHRFTVMRRVLSDDNMYEVAVFSRGLVYGSLQSTRGCRPCTMTFSNPWCPSTLARFHCTHFTTLKHFFVSFMIMTRLVLTAYRINGCLQFIVVILWCFNPLNVLGHHDHLIHLNVHLIPLRFAASPIDDARLTSITQRLDFRVSMRSARRPKRHDVSQHGNLVCQDVHGRCTSRVGLGPASIQYVRSVLCGFTPKRKREI